MADWAVHCIVPLLALLIVARNDHTNVNASRNIRIILYLLPLALLPDLDHFFFLHRAMLHNIFFPGIILCAAVLSTNSKIKYALIVSTVYIASHVILDFFGGGVALFYPLSNSIYFIKAELIYDQGLSWILDWGTVAYSDKWALATGYVMSSISTGFVLILILSAVCIWYRIIFRK